MSTMRISSAQRATQQAPRRLAVDQDDVARSSPRSAARSGRLRGELLREERRLLLRGPRHGRELLGARARVDAQQERLVVRGRPGRSVDVSRAAGRRPAARC